MKTDKMPVLNAHYRLYSKDHYELLRRRAFDETRNSLQLAIDKYNFPEGWEFELEQRRRAHAMAGIPDSKFTPPRKGSKPGRRKIPPLISVAA